MTADGRACDLCARRVSRTTRHHLLPVCRSRKRRRRRQLRPGSEPGTVTVHGAVRPGPECVVDLCPACHEMIHAVLTEKELERRYSSLESLRAHPEIARFVAWVAQQPSDRRVSVRWTRSRRGGRT